MLEILPLRGKRQEDGELEASNRLSVESCLKINYAILSSTHPHEGSTSRMLDLDRGFNSPHALRTLFSVECSLVCLHQYMREKNKNSGSLL